MDFFQNLLNSVRSGIAKPNTQGMKFADLFVKRNVPESAMILDEEYENPTLTGGALSAYRSGKLDLPQAMGIEAGPTGYRDLIANSMGGDVMGMNTQDAFQAPAQPQGSIMDTYMGFEQMKGRTPIEELILTDDEIDLIKRNAQKWAGTVHNSPNLVYRKPETVEENAKYVGEYLDAILRLSPYFDIPPRTLAAMLMEESGWGGERFDGNLGGYGFISTADGGVHDMGIRFDAPAPAEQAVKYLTKLSSDWSGRYQGSRTPEDFVAKGYNTANPNYAKNIRDILSMLLAQ